MLNTLFLNYRKIMRKKHLCSAVLCVCATSFFLSSCIDKDYDLNKDIDLTIQVGSDAFMIPLGYTENITLDKMIDTTDVLKLDENGLYSIKKADEIDPVDINIDDVTITVDDPTFDGITVDFEDKKVKDFNVDVPSNSTNLGAPEINVDVTLPNSQSSSVKEVVPANSKNGSPVNADIEVEGNAEFKFDYGVPEWPEDVRQIETVYIGDSEQGQLVTFKVNTSEVINALKNGAVQSIKSFIIIFPEGVVLGRNKIGRVDGNRFILENHKLTGANEDITFYVVKQELTEATRNMGIHIDSPITYSLVYSINGMTIGDNSSAANIRVDMERVQFIFRKSDAVTNDIKAEMEKDYFNITAEIKDLEDIQKVNYVTFHDSKIVLKISKLELPKGLDFKQGNVIVEFPSRYTLKKESDNKGGTITYNVSTKKLNIPSQYLSEAEVVFSLERAEMGDKYPIINNQINLEDKAWYYVEDANPLILQGNVSTDELGGLNEKTLDVNVDAGLMQVLNSNVDADAIEAEVEDKTTFDIDQDVDEALTVLKTVNWIVGAKPQINMVINFEDFPETIDQLQFNNFNVYLPRFMKFKPEDGVTLGEYEGKTYGVLPLKGRFNPHTGYMKTLTIDSLDFSYIDNNTGLKTVKGMDGKTYLRVDTDKDVKMFGYVQTIAGTEVNTNELKNIPVKPKVTIDPMPVGIISGTVDPKIDDVNEGIELDLGSDLDFLKEQGNSLDVTNPQISLILSNTIGLSVDMTLNMCAKDKNGKIIDGSTVPPANLMLEAAKVEGNPITTKFLLSRKEMKMPESTKDTIYKNVVIEELSNLMKVIPDSVSFNLKAKAHGEEHRVDISNKNMTITGKYDVIVPLEFEAININYKDTIDNLRDDLSDVSGKITHAELKVIGTVSNLIPVDLHLSVNPMDVAGNILEGVKVVVTTDNERTNENGKEYIIGACVEEGKATDTKIVIALTSTGNDLQELENLELYVHASATETQGGVSLKKTQYVQLKDMFLQVKKATIDLNK